MADVTVETKLNEAGTEIGGWDVHIATKILLKGQTEKWTIILKEGWFILIDMSSVIFTPPVKGTDFTSYRA